MESDGRPAAAAPATSREVTQSARSAALLFTAKSNAPPLAAPRARARDDDDHSNEHGDAVMTIRGERNHQPGTDPTVTAAATTSRSFTTPPSHKRTPSPKKKRGFETRRAAARTHAAEAPLRGSGTTSHHAVMKLPLHNDASLLSSPLSFVVWPRRCAPRPCSPRRCRTADSRRHRRRRRRPRAAPGARRRAAAAPRPREKREWCVTRGARIAALFFPAKSHNTVGRSATDRAPPPAVSARARARARDDDHSTQSQRGSCCF